MLLTPGTIASNIFRKTQPHPFFAHKLGPKVTRSRSCYEATFTAGVKPAGVAHPALSRCGCPGTFGTPYPPYQVLGPCFAIPPGLGYVRTYVDTVGELVILRF